MASIIIVENDASPSQLSKAIESAKSITDDVLVVGQNRLQLELTGCLLVNNSNQSLSASIRQAAQQARNEALVIADARATSFSALKRLNDAATLNQSAQIEISSADLSGELIQLPLLAQENIVAIVGLYPHLPLQTYRAQKALVLSSEGEISSGIAFGLSLLIKAISENLEVSYQEEAIRIDSKSNLNDIAFISDSERAEALSQAVAQNNIEDLFPRHAWNEHREESAAAAYHSLAALFVRLGDTQSADDCLQLSDSLEDSPRSLALKGLIANQKGEVLGAVANLVSSLQQYETRKRNNGQHYLTFLPKDIENINSKLLAGLEALNKRENTNAFNHFAEAIFNFDDFYSTYGVDKIKKNAAN